jgi:peptidoglycan L-alanyl-D-glutamate endopeptidase CwlK
MFNNKNNISATVLLLFLSFFYQAAFAALIDDLENLQNAYPSFIKAVSERFIVWYDNSKMPVGNSFIKAPWQKLRNPSLFDQIHQVSYPAGKLSNSTLYPPKTDPGRIRNAAFFGKMYGTSEKDVENKLVTIYWMEKVFGRKYPLRVTTVNQINAKFAELSSDLEKLPSHYYKYLKNPAGSFNWRSIAETNHLSPHSYGISIDLNTDYANYWQWDLAAKNMAIREDAPLTYQNQIPWEIVLLFEKHGFIWGGKWYHYDTMHFEYRPELLAAAQNSPKI